MAEYPHMCRMDHIEIGHHDNGYEQCPMCRVIAALEFTTEVLESYSFSRGHDPRKATPESVIGQAKHALSTVSSKNNGGK